jgi:hypothetical protein
VYPPPLLRGEDRLAGRRGGWGVNILEDERNRIALLCPNPIDAQQNGSVGAEPDLEFEDGVEDELEVEEEDEEDHVDGESTDSMVSAAVFAASTPRPDAAAAAAASPFLVKRTSNASGAIYYQARAVNPAAADEQTSKVGVTRNFAKCIMSC